MFIMLTIGRVVLRPAFSADLNVILETRFIHGEFHGRPSAKLITVCSKHLTTEFYRS